MKGNQPTYRLWFILLAICLLSGGAISVWLGQDANWDLKNYHVYNPWAFLHHRGNLDLFAAGIQTYFNPLLDLPYYLLAFEWLPNKPRTVAFMAGLPYGLLIFLSLCSAHCVLSDLKIALRPRLLVTVIVVAFGVSGAATLPQVGTTFNEIQVASLIIAGVTALLYGLRHNARFPSYRFIFAGGILFGLAAGLKLTATIYAPAAAIALFTVSESRPRAILTLAVFAGGWMLGCIITYGWWGYQLYTATGNPIFPLYEGIFGSRGLGTENWADKRFKPQSLAQAVFYPFYWINSPVPTVAEPMFSDPRFAIALFSMLLLVSLLLLSLLGLRVVRSEGAMQSALPKTGLFILVFTAVSYAIWMKTFSILRYAIPIEVLLGLSIAIIAVVICRRFLHIALSGKTLVVLLALILLGVAANTKYPQWGRTAYEGTVLQVQPVVLAPQAMLVAIGSPQSYVLPSIAKQNPTAQFVGISDDLKPGFGLWDAIIRRIQQFQGRMYVMVRIDQLARLESLPLLGLRVDKENCQSFGTSIDSGFRVCPMYK